MSFLTILISVIIFYIIWFLYTDIKRGLKDISVLSYLKLYLLFRKKDLKKFVADHNRLYEEAKKTGDHSKVTSHFYDVMSDLIEIAYGPAFHFAPKFIPGQSNFDAIKMLHERFAMLCNLQPGKKCLELGCGIGGSMRDIGLYSGADVTGITLSSEEVEENNRLNKKWKLERTCRAVQGDMRALPFPKESFDAVIAIYTLKYISDVDEVMKQVFKVLKKGGRFLIYCLWKSEKYDENIKEHREVINKFEYSCGMPPIHKVTEIIDCAEKNDLKLISKLELSQDEAHSWHTVFSGSKLLMWSMESKLVRYLAYIAECIGLLPQGFDAFMEIFVRGNVLSIVKAAKMGIMSGSEILIFEKQ